jgi:hypothetical protein
MKPERGEGGVRRGSEPTKEEMERLREYCAVLHDESGYFGEHSRRWLYTGASPWSGGDATRVA